MVVLSFVAVHDAQHILQDGWAQIQVQPRNGVRARHIRGLCEAGVVEDGAGRLTAFAPKILVAQVGVGVQAEAPANVLWPADL